MRSPEPALNTRVPLRFAGSQWQPLSCLLFLLWIVITKRGQVAEKVRFRTDRIAWTSLLDRADSFLSSPRHPEGCPQTRDRRSLSDGPYLCEGHSFISAACCGESVIFILSLLEVGD